MPQSEHECDKKSPSDKSTVTQQADILRLYVQLFECFHVQIHNANTNLDHLHTEVTLTIMKRELDGICVTLQYQLLQA
jgi:hypothetical protein